MNALKLATVGCCWRTAPFGIIMVSARLVIPITLSFGNDEGDTVRGWEEEINGWACGHLLVVGWGCLLDQPSNRTARRTNEAELHGWAYHGIIFRRLWHHIAHRRRCSMRRWMDGDNLLILLLSYSSACFWIESGSDGGKTFNSLR